MKQKRRVQHGTGAQDGTIAFACGFVSCWTEFYAKGVGASSTDVARGVGTFLLGTAGGPAHGPDNSVSALRGNTAQGAQVRVPKVAVAMRSRGKAQMNGLLEKVQRLLQQRREAMKPRDVLDRLHVPRRQHADLRPKLRRLMKLHPELKLESSGAGAAGRWQIAAAA